ncbi:MAG: type II toxin-antitoxin system RelB/DinJ family antitoxin [Schwartzia sp.]|nr:type II toxin-antitoxin system RelB/DinJ family antitoxin [Schwartzia sp. (in: firmicutes)]
MSSTVTVQFRMDRELKDQLEAMLTDMGLTVSTAMNLYAKAIVNQARIPFDIKASRYYPNAETRKVLDDAMNGIGMSKRYSDMEEMRRDLDA